MKLNHFYGYTYNEDKLKFEFLKYSIFSSYLFTYYGRKTFLRMLYKNPSIGKMSDYFYDLFEIIELDFSPEEDVDRPSHKLYYLEKSIKEEQPIIYIDPSISPQRIFELPRYDDIYFFSVNYEQRPIPNKYSQIYNLIGVYNHICDDRVFYVPKVLCLNILRDVERIKEEYGFTDSFMDNLLPFIIQTHAIIEDVQIKPLVTENFIEYTDEAAMFLSNCTSVTFKE